MNPTPVAWFCEDESTLSFAEMRGCSCAPLFTEAQLNKARAEALREAAENCFGMKTGDECARMIKGMMK